MSEFKVGDKVRTKASTIWGGDDAVGTRCPTWGGTLTITDPDSGADPTVLARTEDGLVGGFATRDLELVTPAIQAGDTVVVTVTGVVEEANAAMVTLRNVHGESSFLTHTCTSVVVVKKAEPVYEAGRLYRDAHDRLFYRTDEEEWLQLPSDGEYSFSQWPVEPTTVVEVVEPPF